MGEHIEAYTDIDFLRSLIEIEGIENDFVVDPLINDGDRLQKKVLNLSVDLGAVGNTLEQGGMISILDIPSDDEGRYLWEEVNLIACILSDDQVKSFGIAFLPGQRVGVIENELNKKRVFYRIPETDVAELFPKNFVDNECKADSIDYLMQNKENLDGVGDDALKLGRIVYGVWMDAVNSNNLAELEKIMEDVYGNKMTKEVSLVSVYGSLSFGLTQEANLPADNWWLARCTVIKTLEILEKEGNSYKSESVGIVRKIVAEIAYKCFYPEMLYKIVVEPLSKVNYGDGVKLLDGAEMAEIKSRVEEYSTQKKTITE